MVFVAAGILLVCDTCSPDFWSEGEGFLFAIFTTLFSMVILWPAYLVYAIIVLKIFRRRNSSFVVTRRWLLGLPVLLLICAALVSANNMRPTVAIRWISKGKTVRSIHSVHASHLSLMMSDRWVAWFKIDPEELRGLIAQHQLAITNITSFSEVLRMRRDHVLGETEIADRAPSFADAVCYARVGSDEFQHQFSIFALTNPDHNTAIWYMAYDR